MTIRKTVHETAQGSFGFLQHVAWWRKNSGKLASFIVLLITSLILILPFIWMVMTSLKPMSEVVLFPPHLFPREFRFENYVEAWKAAPFALFYWNSIFTGLVATFLQVLFSLTMAYAFVFIRFPAKKVLFTLVLITMMIPDEMKLIPNYLVLARLDWIDTYWALIVPPIAHAFPVFVMTQQFRTFPMDLFEAAKVDGATHLQILIRIVIPISWPMLSAVFLVSFVGRWNDYLWPLIVTNSVEMRTLPIGLTYLRAIEGGVSRWNLLMAASVFVIFPILILFLFTQKQFVEGITRGAIKG